MLQAVLTCSGDSTIKLWGAKDGTCLRTFSGHSASVLRARFNASGTVVLSAGGDGLIKSWNTHSGQCLSTLAAHDGKVWALEVATKDSDCVLSGSDTGSLALWAIKSTQAEEEERAQTEELIQQQQVLSKPQRCCAVLNCILNQRRATEASSVTHQVYVWRFTSLVLFLQELQNAIALKQHVKAAKLALKLQQPRQLLEIVKAVLHVPQTIPLTHKGYIAQLAPFAKTLSQSDMQSIFTYVRDWNTSPKNCTCAQALLGAVLATHAPKVLCLPGHTFRLWYLVHLLNMGVMCDLCLLQDIASVQGLQETSEALLLYSGRHYDRMDRMLQSTYLLDYLLSRLQLFSTVATAT